MMENQYTPRLKEEFLKIDVRLNDRQAEQLYQYYELLVETNKVMNLTAITEFEDVVKKHFIDSIICAKLFLNVDSVVDNSPQIVDNYDTNVDNSKKTSSRSLIDVGTGAGFPGIPLKILYPQLKVTLLDSLNKRLHFLNQVIEQLGLKNIQTVHYRAEDGARDKTLRDSFDYAVSRAVANMSTLTEYCLPYVKTGGIFAAYKSGNIEDELNNSHKAVFLLGGKLEAVHKYTLPESDMGRSLVVIRKKEPTNRKYPRKAGLPGKEPIIG